LIDGYTKCLKHVTNLIEASEILYSAKKYFASIPLSVLAIEESYKIVLFQQHLSSKQGISEMRWKKISQGDAAHRHKLTSIFDDSKTEIRDRISEQTYNQVAAFQETLYGTKVIPYKTAIKQAGVETERLAALNEIKKHCFYLHWDDPEWSNFCLSTSEA